MFRKNWIQQSIKAKIAISIIFIMVTLLIASAGFSQEQTVSEQKSLMDVTPAKPLLFAEMSGISGMINKDSNFWKQIAQAPFWELLYAELEKETKVKDIPLAIEPGLLLLSHLFGQDVIFVMPEFKQLTEISPLFMFRLKDDDDLGIILSQSIKIALANAAKTTSEYGGYTVSNIPLPNAPFGVSCALVGNIFAIGLGDTTLKKVIDLVNGSKEANVAITQDADFMSIMKRISSKTGQNLAVCHLNLAKVVALGNLFYAMFSRQIPDERLRPIVGMALKWLDLVPSVTSVSTITDKGIVSQNYMSLNPNATSKNFLAMLKTEPGQLRSMKFAPEDAIGYNGNNLIDLKRIWEMAYELIANMPNVGEQALEQLEQMQQQFGLNLKEDLFSWMDNEVGVIYSDFPGFSKNTGFIMPGKICLLLKVTDSAKASQGLQKLAILGINIAKGKYPDMEISIQPQEYMGETIYTVSQLPVPDKPGYAIVNNFLLISPSVEYIKKLIDCSAGRIKGISASAAFQSVKAQIPEKVNGIEFVDMGRYMEQMISSTIKASGGEKLPNWEDANLTLDKVMMLQLTELGKALSKAWGPSINIVLNDGTGLKSNSLVVFKDLETVVPISDPPVAKILRSIQIANDYRDVRMVDRALKYYTKALELDGDNFEALMGTAQMLQRQDRVVEAEEYWSRIGFPPESAWYVIGPYDNSSGAGFDTAYPPEEKVDLDAEYEGVGATINWEQWADDKPDGFVDFQYMFEPDQWVAAYAWTTVTSPDTREAQLRVGSDDGIKVWLNGKEALNRNIARAASPDQNIVSVTLNEGENQLLVKVCNQEMAWGFYLRFTDSNGKALEDLEYGR
jgi:hypothetical protein